MNTTGIKKYFPIFNQQAMGIYNTREDVDRLVYAILQAKKIFNEDASDSKDRVH